jgi:hypothetical protein
MRRPSVQMMGLSLWLALRRSHPVQWINVGLLAIVVLGCWLWLPTLRAQTQAARMAVQQGRVQLNAAQRMPQTAQPVADSDRLQAFERQLGEAARIEDTLRNLFAIAKRLGIEPGQGQYKMQCEPRAVYCRYQVLWPVRGPYGALRALAEQSLHAVPFASLDDFSLRRETAGSDEMEGRLGLSLHLRDSGDWRTAEGREP